MNNLSTANHVAFSLLPQSVRDLCTQYAESPYAFLPADCVDALCRDLAVDKSGLGLVLLPFASSFAEVPVSNFRVGALAFDSVGNAYLGANFEFAGTHISQTMHAEQSAIAHAWSRGARDLALIVINYAPCGHCRQFMNEVNVSRDFLIVLPDVAPKSLSDFLPHAFGPADLGVDARILGVDARILGGELPACNSDMDLFELAKVATLNAHAPYSNSLSGVALRYADGEPVIGRYAENAAFNPSLPALQVALNYRRLQGKDWRDIEDAVMVEQQSTLSQRDNANALLASVNASVELRYSTL